MFGSGKGGGGGGGGVLLISHEYVAFVLTKH